MSEDQSRSESADTDEQYPPNPAQQRLIDHTEGIYLVDAGAGTGKTFAISRRYAQIVDKPDVEPEDVLLVTFTRNAAAEMRERIVERSSYSVVELADAPISTFHSLCSDLLRQYGHTAPTYLGLDDRITDSTRIVEDDLVGSELFREFFDGFRENNPEYAPFFRIIEDETNLQGLIEQLAAKGIVPTDSGWYGDGERVLLGDFEGFREQFETVNEPRNDGRKMSRLRSKLSTYDDNTYLPDAPSKTAIRGERTKQVPEEMANRAFEGDRSDLEEFVHELYYSYLEYALSRNYLSFGLLQVFAFVLLCENDRVRQEARFQYVMIDEFQDTSEIQFKLAILLTGAGNLCVVGDWKQSIYAFQYADVDNIRQFESRLRQFSTELSGRVGDGSAAGESDEGGSAAGESITDSPLQQLDFDTIERIELTENYRSTQSILDFSEHSLVTPATKSESVDSAVLDDVVSLKADTDAEGSTIAGVQHEHEYEAILTLVQEIVDNEEYALELDDGTRRTPEYGDIAVFTRTQTFGRELLAEAEEYGLPMAYDGGIELFRTDQAKLLLAWLRIVESDADRGWAAVLEAAGYTYAELKHLLDSGEYPDKFVAFRNRLETFETIGAIARAVFDRYGYTGGTADALVETLQSTFDTSTILRGELIRFIERGIEEGTTREVATGDGLDSVTVQTIHAAKGLEYPIVILANVNRRAFPSQNRGGGVIQYDERTGIRQRKIYAETGAFPYVYDNWRYELLKHCQPSGYDEERRLLYVAITRAQRHVFVVGGTKPSTFYEELPFTERHVHPDVKSVDDQRTVQTELPFRIDPPSGPIGLSAHHLIDDAVFEEGHTGEPTLSDDAKAVNGATIRATKGIANHQSATAFGTEIHDFAQEYADGALTGPALEEPEPDKRNVAAFIDTVEGKLHTEERVYLPLSVDGEQVTIVGDVDLVCEGDEEVAIVDYKTDRSRQAEAEYRKQVSVYYHVLTKWFANRPVTVSLYYTGLDERVQIDPLSGDELLDTVRGVLTQD